MTKKEKSLLGVFLGMIVVMAVLFGVNFYLQERNEMIAKRDRLKAESVSAEQSEALHVLYAEDKEWLEQDLPEPIEYNVAQSEFLSMVEKLPKKHKLVNDVTEPRGKDEAGSFTRVIMETRAKGSQKDVVQWLKELHKPRSFQIISSLTIKRDAKDDLLLCKVLVERYIIEKQYEEF